MTLALTFVFLTSSTSFVWAIDYNCGQKYQDHVSHKCNCSGGKQQFGGGYVCCGWISYVQGVKTCSSIDPNTVTGPAPTLASDDPSRVGNPVTAETLDALNPLKQESNLANELSTPAGIINRLMTFLFPLAGLILFVMIVWGGFEMMTGSVNKKSVESGKQRVTSAIVGFMLLFASYWIAQIIEAVFGIKIL